MVEGGPGEPGVVVGALGQLDDLRARSELLHRRGAARQRVAAGLVGQRDADLGAGEPRERVDRVELRGGQLVEAVEEHGPPAPARRVGPQRVERRPRRALAVGAPERLQPPPVGGIQRRELVGVGRAAPGAQGAREARGLDQRALQLGEQRARRGGEPGRRRRRREPPQVRVGDRRPHHAVARDPPQRPRLHPGDAPDLPHQVLEGEHLRAEDDPAGGQLLSVVRHVGGGRHDEQRLEVQDRAQALQHVAGLGGVGGSGY